MNQFKNEYISAGLCRINRIHHPAGAKKPIILLHGAKFDADTWLQLGTLEQLIQVGYPVHALDMPGFGKSQSCAAAESIVISAYIQQEELDRPVIIGPSRGGRYALELYFSHPDLVGGLVLVGTVGVQENISRFKEIMVPCLLVWGSEDTISDPENGCFLKQEIPDAELVILLGAPHPCYLEKTEQWHQALLTFLEYRF
jgi:abhydrolase domain-containing protein 14